MQEDFREAGLMLVGITAAGRREARTFARVNDLNYPVLAEAGANFQSYRVEWVPANFLVDPTGEVVAKELDHIHNVLTGQFAD